MNKVAGNSLIGGTRMSFEEFHPYCIGLYFTFVMGITMVISNLFIVFASFLSALFYNTIQRGWKSFFKDIALILTISLILCLLNGTFVHQGETVLFYFNSNPITLESICFGLFSGFKLGTVLLWFILFNKAFDGEKISFLFGRVSSLFALMISMTLRYIPLLKVRYKEIEQGQRYLNYQSSGKIKGFDPMIRRLSSLISWTLESSIDTGISMESRGYGIGKRSSFHLYSTTVRDKLLIGVFVLSFMIFVYLNVTFNLRSYFYPRLLVFSSSKILTGIATLVFVVASLIPPAIDLVEEVKWRRL